MGHQHARKSAHSESEQGLHLRSDPSSPASVVGRALKTPGRPLEGNARARYEDALSQQPIGHVTSVSTLHHPATGVDVAAADSDAEQQARATATRVVGEPRVGQRRHTAVDLSRVRIHTDAAAHSAAQSLSARAFTMGSDVFLGQSARASTADMNPTLAHELVHVIQQGSDAHTQPGTVAFREDSESWTQSVSKWYDKQKWAAYRALIAALKSAKGAGIGALRRQVPSAPVSMQGALTTILDIVDFVLDLDIALLLAIIGLAVGFVEGIVGLVTGILKLAWSLLNFIAAAFVAILGKPEQFNNDLNTLVSAVKGIPEGMKKMIDDWLARYKKATLEEQVLMGAELVGQIEAFIATFAVAGTKAGQAGSLTVRVPALGEGAVVGSKGAAALEPATAVAATIPKVVPKTVAEGAVVSAQMMAASGQGPGGGGAGPLAGATDKEIDDALKDIKPAGTPQKLQPHSAATPNRKALDVSGRDVQSAHGAPQSVMKGVKGYNPDHALTKLMERGVHSGMDQYWKETFRAWRRAGRTEATAQDIYDTVAESIRRAPGLADGDKSSLVLRLSDEMFVEYGLKADDVLPLPYANIKPAP